MANGEDVFFDSGHFASELEWQLIQANSNSHKLHTVAVHSPPSLSICELETWKARDRAVSINPHKFTEVHTTSYNFIQFPNDTHVMRFFAGQRLEILICLCFQFCSVRSSVWFSFFFGLVFSLWCLCVFLQSIWSSVWFSVFSVWFPICFFL